MAGLEGLIDLYCDYRLLTDQLYEELYIPKMSLENSGKQWAKYEKAIVSVLMNDNSGSAVLRQP